MYGVWCMVLIVSVECFCTYIVLLFWCHGVNEVLLVHEPFSILVLLRMKHKIGTGLMREMVL